MDPQRQKPAQERQPERRPARFGVPHGGSRQKARGGPGTAQPARLAKKLQSSSSSGTPWRRRLAAVSASRSPGVTTRAPATAGSARTSAEETGEVLAESAGVAEGGHVEGDEEVGDTAGLVEGGRVKMGELGVEGHPGEQGAEDLDHHPQALPLVPPQRLEDGLLPFHHPAGLQGEPVRPVVLDLGVGDLAGGEVGAEEVVPRPLRRHRDRVGAEDRPPSAVRRHQGVAVGEGEPDHPLARHRQGVDRGGAEVVGIAHRHRSHPVLAGDPHGLVRRHPAGDQAEGVAGVEHPRGALPRPAELGVGLAAAAVELGQVGGKQADAVRVDAAQGGLEEPVDHIRGVLRGEPPPAQGLGHQAGQGFGGDGPQSILSRTKRAKRSIPSAILSSST